MDSRTEAALKELILKIADDQLIYGHRNSEWTGLGPILEEDIAFSSIAQDKIGQAFNLYILLHQKLNEADPEILGFQRKPEEFKCCHLVEHPINEYDFSLIRHFLFDHAELLRFDALSNSSFQPLAQLAKKYLGEIRYHVFHANTFVQQLGKATEESRIRMQQALDFAFPLALGIFEPGEFEDLLQQEGIFIGEEQLKENWLIHIKSALEVAQLKLPDPASVTPQFGGRKGKHTEYFPKLLEEMTEVLRSDPGAEW
jgi:ring-1,2-phenylacetyl-CoA epoxidase subunit PaaC